MFQSFWRNLLTPDSPSHLLEEVMKEKVGFFAQLGILFNFEKYVFTPRHPLTSQKRWFIKKYWVFFANLDILCNFERKCDLYTPWHTLDRWGLSENCVSLQIWIFHTMLWKFFYLRTPLDILNNPWVEICANLCISSNLKKEIFDPRLRIYLGEGIVDRWVSLQILTFQAILRKTFLSPDLPLIPSGGPWNKCFIRNITLQTVCINFHDSYRPIGHMTV